MRNPRGLMIAFLFGIVMWAVLIALIWLLM